MSRTEDTPTPDVKEATAVSFNYRDTHTNTSISQLRFVFTTPLLADAAAGMIFLPPLPTLSHLICTLIVCGLAAALKRTIATLVFYEACLL